MQENDAFQGTIQICSSYLAANKLTPDELILLLTKVHATLSSLGQGEPPLMPAVPIAESVKDDHIVCLEDGEQVVLLKRYLQKHHNMTPEEYLVKWNLPEDYPFVAKNYSQRRSKIAKEQGLGKTPEKVK